MALVFVLFLLWTNWLEFQARKYGPAPQAQAPASDIRPDDAPPLPAAPPRQDVPDLIAPEVAAPTEQPLDSAQQVRVQTDLFDIVIDTVGGDIRYAGLRTYPETVEQPDQPFALLQDTRRELFIAQSGLLSSQGLAPDHYAQFTAEQTEYQLQDGQDTLKVPLRWRDPSGLEVIKTYTFQRDSFVIELTHAVQNGTDEAWQGSQYRQFQRTPPPSKRSMLGGVYTYTGGVISTPEQRYEKISFSDMADENLDREVQGGWVAMIQHYFLGAWVPQQDNYNTFYSRDAGANRYVIGMVSAPQSAPVDSTVEFKSQLYVGPKIQDRLSALAPNLELTVDYGYLTVIAQPLFWILEFIHDLVGNWGWAIIILTVLIKLVFYKLSETSYKSMANMRRLAPELNRLKERYGDDKQKMHQAMMEMYKKEKINPLGGCLPIVVQIPVFIALYWVLVESVELRQAPFMLWIQDLSAKDPFFVLPLIMGASMFIQQKLNPPPPDPMQAKVMMALPAVFTVLFLWFPAGLVLYWVVNNVLSIAQQYVITKRVEAGAKT